MLILVFAMLLSLSACGMFETRLARAVQKMSRIDNLHFELSAQLELSLSLDESAGEEQAQAADTPSDEEDKTAQTGRKTRSLPLRASFEGSGELFTKPLLARFTTLLKLPGSRTRSENYLEKDGNAYYLYSRTNDGTLWQKQGLASGDDTQIKGIQYIVKGAESFSSVGQEDVRGRAAERYDGVLYGEFISGLLTLYRVQDFLSDQLGLPIKEELFDELPDAPASLWLDQESGMLVRLRVDLTEAARCISGRQLSDTREALALDTLGLKLDVEALSANLYLSEFDEAEAFSIPDEAKAAWGAELKPWES